MEPDKPDQPTQDQKSSPSGPMIARFADNNGLLNQVLSEESVLRGAPGLMEFSRKCELEEIAEGTELIRQGDPHNDIFFILSGSFETRVNGRPVYTRSVGEHVGEIALIDPTSRRTASVFASEHSLVLKCPEPHFSEFANSNPRIWRRLAVVLSRRLTQRNKLIRAPRTEPVIFIACATEGLPVAREIQAAFDYDPFTVELWIDGVFAASNTPIEDLTALVARIDFAIVLMTADDKITARKSEHFGARDNVVFELGLAIGAIGRQRVFMLSPRGSELKVPTDLLGVMPLDFPTGESNTLKSRLGPACNEIRKLVNRMGAI